MDTKVLARENGSTSTLSAQECSKAEFEVWQKSSCHREREARATLQRPLISSLHSHLSTK